MVTGDARAGVSADGSGSVAYVSLPPGALPLGSLVRIRVERTGVVVSAALFEGGLDPVAVPAVPGDTISLAVERSGGASLMFRFTVEIRKPPILVRTKPAKNKRDVPLNLRLEVVFSEPIDPGSLTPENFELRLAGNRVETELGFGNPSHTIVELTPSAELSAAKDYELILGPGIHDTDGTPLVPDRVPFTTVGPAPGSLSITTVTTGIEFAPTAYGVGLNGGAVEPIGLNGTRTIPLTPGTYTVTLSGLGARCGLIDTNPLVATVPAGADVPIRIAVNCTAVQYAFIGEDGIYLINSDGTAPRRVRQREPLTTILTLAWSPDRQRLAFGIDYDDGSTPAAIHIMNADGSNEIRFTDAGPNRIASHQPAWSPDGDEIVYTSYFHEGGPDLASFSLYSRPVNGGSERLLLAHSFATRFIMPAWSPAGGKITFSTTGAAAAEQGHLYIMNADGSGVRPLLLAPTGTWYRESAWSPDGLKVAVRVCVMLTPDPVTYRCAIAVMNIDGSAYREIAPSDESEWRRSLTWAPDSTALVFAGPDGVQLIRADGGPSVNEPDFATSPAGVPAAGRGVPKADLRVDARSWEMRLLDFRPIQPEGPNQCRW